jgi:two-component system cell cycle response regulator
MALRVLLADESSTIKKVFQLSLQDYAVEIKNVNLGIDVISVAENFQPDVIFADVLLQKKNGYEVTTELKRHDGLKHIPVVLMWSNFIEIDEDKFDASGATDKLEKPFDVSTLRQLVQKLVPRTKTQKLSQFLNFPSIAQHFVEPNSPQTAAPKPQAPKDSTWNMESFENMDNFAGDEVNEDASKPQLDTTMGIGEANAGSDWGPALPLEEEGSIVAATAAQEDGDWVRKDIASFKVDVEPGVDLDADEVPVDFAQPDQDEDNFVVSRPVPPTPPPPTIPTSIPVSEVVPEVKPQSSAPPPRAAGLPPQLQRANELNLTEEQIEKIIRERAEKIIESVVWKVVPDLAAQIVERELKKLMRDL